MLVKELKSVIVNRYLVYKIMNFDKSFVEKYHVIPLFFYDFEVKECYFHHNEFVDMLDIIIESGETK